MSIHTIAYRAYGTWRKKIKCEISFYLIGFFSKVRNFTYNNWHVRSYVNTAKWIYYKIKAKRRKKKLWQIDHATCVASIRNGNRLIITPSSSFRQCTFLFGFFFFNAIGAIQRWLAITGTEFNELINEEEIKLESIKQLRISQSCFS